MLLILKGPDVWRWLRKWHIDGIHHLPQRISILPDVHVNYHGVHNSFIKIKGRADVYETKQRCTSFFAMTVIHFVLYDPPIRNSCRRPFKSTDKNYAPKIDIKTIFHKKYFP